MLKKVQEHLTEIIDKESDKEAWVAKLKSVLAKSAKKYSWPGLEEERTKIAELEKAAIAERETSEDLRDRPILSLEAVEQLLLECPETVCEYALEDFLDVHDNNAAPGKLLRKVTPKK